jgi:hypothetical protein
MRQSMKRFLFILLALALFTGIAHACPMCKDSIPNSDASEASGVPIGFTYSVYLMLAGFLSVLGLISGIVVKGVRSTPNQIPKKS